ncbi:MAG: hypothetical protein JWP88_1336 [Flaviaesturariibacter sp.]|nr:hypothetical protein [Flaviaesturariibacter sp.]
MPKSTETGHAVNLGQLDRLTTVVRGFGTAYAPNRDEIKLTNLDAYKARCDAALGDVNTVEAAFHAAVNDRRETFDRLKPLCTRIVGAYEDSNASAADVTDVRSLNKKLQGQRVSQPKLPKAGEEAVATNSASQQGYTNLAAHFDRLLTHCEANTGYTGGVPELELPALRLLHTRLVNLNKSVDATATAITGARKKRDNIFYADGVSMVEIGERVRSYVRKQFTGDSPEFAQLKGIKFRDLAK